MIGHSARPVICRRADLYIFSGIEIWDWGMAKRRVVGMGVRLIASSPHRLIGARRTAHGARRTAHGARRTAHGARRTAHGARRTAHGARRTAHGARRRAKPDKCSFTG